jgi:hypothetical protein
MGRYYYGDIEGKFAFGIQSSYDPEEFGTKALEMYQWTCGCSSEKGEPSDCDCIVEHVHNYDPENGPVCDKPEGPNGPCLKTEDENIQEDEFKTLKFNFDDSMIPYIREQLINIYEHSYDPEIKDKFLDYMSEEFSGERKGRTDEELAEEFNTTVSNLREQFKLYYRHELGLEICEYLEEHDTCTFFGDV